jgi:hypothetical protein
MVRPIRSMIRIFISTRWPSYDRTQYSSIKLTEEVGTKFKFSTEKNPPAAATTEPAEY